MLPRGTSCDAHLMLQDVHDGFLEPCCTGADLQGISEECLKGTALEVAPLRSACPNVPGQACVESEHGLANRRRRMFTGSCRK